MIRYCRRIPYPSLSLAIYLACLVLVCSFILFEVLDVDGSDFPSRPSSPTAIRAAEPSHDIKRAHLQILADSWADSYRLSTGSPTASPRDQVATLPVAPLRPLVARPYRPALPRAALADPLPSA
ncbi:MAG: hypothetical protein HY217_07460 [Candidatus Rokubacteria bacterium]|nr:hypothetical protein [Candidatus Rokubacteria bacterium]